MKNNEKATLYTGLKGIFVSFGFALLAVTLLSNQAHAQAAPVKNKIVFQVSDNDRGKWGLALNNVQNVQADLGAASVDMEIVVYGPGIGMLKDDSIVASRVAEVMKSGVKVVACETTLKAQKISKSEMMPDIGYVPAGVVELMRKQQQGYAYIRP